MIRTAGVFRPTTSCYLNTICSFLKCQCKNNRLFIPRRCFVLQINELVFCEKVNKWIYFSSVMYRLQGFFLNKQNNTLFLNAPGSTADVTAGILPGQNMSRDVMWHFLLPGFKKWLVINRHTVSFCYIKPIYYDSQHNFYQIRYYFNKPW